MRLESALRAPGVSEACSVRFSMGKNIRQKAVHIQKTRLLRASGFLAFLSFFILLATGCVEQSMPEPGEPQTHVYESKCGLCHKPFHPLVHTSVGWKNVVARMEKNAAEQGMVHFLNDEERGTILEYLTRHSRKGF